MVTFVASTDVKRQRERKRRIYKSSVNIFLYNSNILYNIV